MLIFKYIYYSIVIGIRFKIHKFKNLKYKHNCKYSYRIVYELLYMNHKSILANNRKIKYLEINTNLTCQRINKNVFLF